MRCIYLVEAGVNPVSLRECLARFAWASRDVDYLKAELAPLERAYRDAKVTNTVDKRGRIIEYILEGDLPPLPPEIGLRIGDCVHHLRATLDNLAYTIATENNAVLTSKERKAVTFPICTHSADWRENVVEKHVLDVLPMGAQAAIEGLQPYHRRPDPDRHSLAILRELSDMDKHRTIPVVTWSYAPASTPTVWRGAAPDASGDIDLTNVSELEEERPLFEDIPGVRWTTLTDEVIPGASFLRLEVPRAYAHLQMHVMFSFGFGVKEPKHLRERRIARLLNRICDHVRNTVIPALAPYCPATPSVVMTEASRRVNFGFEGKPGSLERLAAETD